LKIEVVKGTDTEALEKDLDGVIIMTFRKQAFDSMPEDIRKKFEHQTK
jgi:hypothetical protein